MTKYLINGKIPEMPLPSIYLRNYKTYLTETVFFVLMTIKLKSLRQSRESFDGFRILITRFRPRYIKKENENWDAWYRELAPSRQLWHDYFKSNKIDWKYRERFIEEIIDNPKSIELIHWLSKFENNNNNITLICFCENERKCHRSIVKEMVLDYYLRQQP
jgi:uncharacterized protein YeaO (DUF488 family)